MVQLMIYIRICSCKALACYNYWLSSFSFVYFVFVVDLGLWDSLTKWGIMLSFTFPIYLIKTEFPFSHLILLCKVFNTWTYRNRFRLHNLLAFSTFHLCSKIVLVEIYIYFHFPKKTSLKWSTSTICLEHQLLAVACRLHFDMDYFLWLCSSQVC